MFTNFKVFLFLLIFTTSAFAIDLTVFYVKGEVFKVNSQGETTALKKGDSLIEGDSVKTKKDSLAILKAKGHSTHKIEQNTEIEISKLPYKFKKSDLLDQEGDLLLKAGTIFSEVTKSKGKKALTITSNNTAMAVRGTTLMVSRDLKTNDVWLAVKKGEVEIENYLSGQKDILTSKQAILVEEDRRFIALKRYKWMNNVSWEVTNTQNPKSFSKIKKQALKETQQRKTKWVRNEVLFQEKEKSWKKDEVQYKKETKNLSVKEIKTIRLKRINKINRSKNKPNFSGGILKKEKLRKNNFLNLQKRSRLENRKKLLNRSQNKRRRNRPIPRPDTAPQVPSLPGGTGTPLP